MTIIDIERPTVTHDEPGAVVPAPEAPAPASTVATATRAVASGPVGRAAAPTASPRTPRLRLFADLGGPLSRTWGVALVVAWVVVVAVGLMVEPAAADPDAPVPLVADLLSTGLLATWGAMAAGVFQRRRFAAAASMVGGLGLLALTLGCPLSGHHAGIGAWWGVQIVGAVALLALSGRALRSS